MFFCLFSLITNINKNTKLILAFYLSNVKFSNNLILENQLKCLNSSKKVANQFIFVLCLLSFFLTKKSLKTKTSGDLILSFFVKKKSKKLFTLLRAPFRHKLAKKHYNLHFYKLILRIKVFFKIGLNVVSLNTLVNIFKQEKTVYLKHATQIDTNICSQYKIKSNALLHATKGILNIYESN